MCAPCYETEVIQNLSEPQYIYITLVSYSLLINYIEIVIQTSPIDTANHPYKHSFAMPSVFPAVSVVWFVFFQRHYVNNPSGVYLGWSLNLSRNLSPALLIFLI